MISNYICYYSNFVNIDRAVWQLLPMGLFTDSLIRDPQKDANGEADFFTYTKKIQVQVPFNKGSINFDNSYLRGIYDSLELTKDRPQILNLAVTMALEHYTGIMAQQFLTAKRKACQF